MTDISVRIYKNDDWTTHGYGRWFFEVTRNGRLIHAGGGHCEERRVRSMLSSWARYSNLRGEEAYAVDIAALPNYDNGMPRVPWEGLGSVERYSWDKARKDAG